MFLVTIFSILLFQTKADSLNDIKLNEIKVSVNKFEASQLESIGFIRQINSLEISKENSSTSADLLSNSGNFFVQKSQAGGGSPVMRGFEANKILLVVDGVKMNNLIYRGGHLQNILRIDPFSLEKIDAFFGTNSLIYGSDALGGVIYLKTKNPKFEINESNIFARYGSSNNEKTIHFDLNLSKRKIANYTSFSFSDFENSKQGKNRNEKYPDFGKRFNYVTSNSSIDLIEQNSNENSQIGTAYSQFDFVNKVSFKQSEKTSHLINFQYSTTSDVPRYDRLFFTKNSLPAFSVWNYGPEKRMLIAYQLDLKKTQMYDEANLTIANQKVEESRITRRYKNDNLISQIEKVNVNSINFDLLKKIKTHSEIQYGLEIKSDKVDSKANSRNIKTNEIKNVTTRYPDGGGSMNNSAIYATYKLKSKKAILNFGLRGTNSKLNAKFIDTKFVTDNFKNVAQKSFILTKSIGFKYFPVETIQLTSSFSEGFRSPNIDDLGKVFEAIPGQIIIPNINLQPEKTKNIEFIFNSKIQKKLNVYFGIYQTYLKNAITVAPTLFDGKSKINYNGEILAVYTSQNINSAQINGQFTGLDYQINSYLNLGLNFNRTKGFKNNERRLAMGHIPPNFGKLNINYQKNKIYLELNMLYNGFKSIDNFELNGEDNPQFAYQEGSLAWKTINFKSNFETKNNFKFSLNIENILDLNYRTFASGINANGRNLVCSIAKKF